MMFLEGFSLAVPSEAGSLGLGAAPAFSLSLPSWVLTPMCSIITRLDRNIFFKMQFQQRPAHHSPALLGTRAGKAGCGRG